MTDSRPANFADNMHAIDYLAPYDALQTDANSYFDLAMRDRESLDGDWHFAIDPYDTCLRSRWWEESYADPDGRPYPVDFSFDEWETIPVPSCWNTRKDIWQWYEGSAVYVRNFDFIPGPGPERVFLTFGAASYAAYVFLNGKYIGWHQGGSTPFRFEVTGKLRSDNRLIVVVNNTRHPFRVPTDNTDWFNYGGLHRTVNIVRMPTTFIETVSIGLRPDGSLSTVVVGLTTDGMGMDGIAEISIPGLDFNDTFEVTGGVAREEFTLHPALWSPEDPQLYDVYIRYGGDEWHDRVGFREIRVEGTDILLNGEPIFLAGVCQHEDSVKNGRTLTDKEIRDNIKLAKEMGCRFMRLAHYPHNAQVAKIADEMGMLLWEEIPVYWAVDFSSDATFADADNQLRELIQRDRNRASVIIWSVGNENADTDERLDFMSRLVDTCHLLDPTRLVSAACLVDPTIPAIDDRLADKLDIIGVNEYYGWYEPDFARLPMLFENSSISKPVIITEFGADAVAGRHGADDEMFTEEMQLAVYKRQIEVLSSIPYIKGTTPWILYDFRCPRRTHILQGYYNRKGLLSPDKKTKKLAFFAMQEWYKSL